MCKGPKESVFLLAEVACFCLILPRSASWEESALETADQMVAPRRVRLASASCCMASGFCSIFWDSLACCAS